MTWVKICGITNLEDALTAVEAGADALGFVFYEKSPRNVDPETVREIVEALPTEIDRVGVFVNQPEDAICAVAEQARLSAIQMHGHNEDPRVADLVVARRPDLKIVAGISMRQPRPESWAMMWRTDVVHAFLVDSGDSSKNGGTGETFDWQAGRKSVELIASLGRVVLAGGLTHANVTQAVCMLRPWGVDVSSGVESSPGKKDPEKVKAFVTVVRQAERLV
jgi:phosphoribosylanthranilate isomerase